MADLKDPKSEEIQSKSMKYQRNLVARVHDIFSVILSLRFQDGRSTLTYIGRSTVRYITLS